MKNNQTLPLALATKCSDSVPEFYQASGRSMIKERRYDVDWLRSLAFILLIFYHIGMFYVADWGWHVKSQYQSEFLQNLMILLNQWRMPLIFLISGMALAFIEPKIDTRQLLRLRFARIFLPLLIGMYLIVPPQLYFELVQKEGFAGSYQEFFLFYINPHTTYYPNHQHSPLGLLTWNHLWYLAYLWHYTLAYLCLRPLLRRIDWLRLASKISAPKVFLLLLTLLSLYGLFLKPIFPKTHALVDDWYTHALYFTLMLFGYCTVKCDAIWQGVICHRNIYFGLALGNYALILLLNNDGVYEWLGQVGFDTEVLLAMPVVKMTIQVIVYANVISWLFTVLGFAAVYLNKNHRYLHYLNEAVLPWYIIHQSVTIVIAMQLSQFRLGPIAEPILLIVLTFVVCFLMYEVIRRFNSTRLLLGMKIKQDK